MEEFKTWLYYVEILKKIPNCQTVEDYEKLLPWSIDLKKMRQEQQNTIV